MKDRTLYWIQPANLLLAGLIFTGLYLTGRANYLLFHGLAELFSVIVASCIFIIAWNSRRFIHNGYLLFIGISAVFIGGVDLLHTLAYKGMGVFPGDDANLPTQLWIAARYLHSLSFLIAPYFLYRPVKPRLVFLAYAGVMILLLLSIFYWQIFPASFIEGSGLTPFKKISELVISGIFGLAIVLLWRNRAEFDRRVLSLLAGSIAVCILSELAFTGYVQVTDQINMAGHLLKIVAFYLVYQAIVMTGFREPYNLLFRSLKRSEDELRQARDELEERVRLRTREVVEANQALQAEIAGHQRTEDELRQYRGRLEELVEARTAELQKEIAERQRAENLVKDYAALLEHSNRELQDFASIASHDLQEPLRKIQAFGDRLAANLSGKLSQEESFFLERILGAAGRMSRMIDDLLIYSRVAIRPRPPEPVDLNQVAAEVVADLEVRIERSGGRVDVGDLPMVEADRVQMQQLFQNLIGNALKFHPPAQPPMVRVYARPAGSENGSGERVEILVEDNGIGFEATKAEQIFQPFTRLVGRSEYEGNGMGLAICQKIVERLGGAIQARSAPGQGATFIISLPVRQGERSEPEQKPGF